MSKKNKTGTGTENPASFNVGRRRAIGVLLQGTVHLMNMLTRQLEGHIKEVDEQWGIMNYLEMKHTKQAFKEMRMAKKRLDLVARRMRG